MLCSGGQPHSSSTQQARARGSLQPPAWVGNDVVDLTVAGTPRSARFVERTCTVAERERLSRSSCPERLLWTLWAAKEAAHKVLVKCRPRVFSPVGLEVSADLTTVWVHDEQLALPLAFDEGCLAKDPSTYIHAWSWMLVGPDSGEAVLRHGLVHRVESDDESRAVREALCRAESSRLGVDRHRLCVQRDVGGWPRLLLDDEPTAIDVSLSHDGRFVAWAAVG